MGGVYTGATADPPGRVVRRREKRQDARPLPVFQTGHTAFGAEHPDDLRGSAPDRSESNGSFSMTASSSRSEQWRQKTRTTRSVTEVKDAHDEGSRFRVPGSQADCRDRRVAKAQRAR